MQEQEFYIAFDIVCGSKIGAQFTYDVDVIGKRRCVLTKVTPNTNEGPYIQYEVTDSDGVMHEFVMSKYGPSAHIHNLRVLNTNSVKHLLRQVRAK